MGIISLCCPHASALLQLDYIESFTCYYLQTCLCFLFVSFRWKILYHLLLELGSAFDFLLYKRYRSVHVGNEKTVSPRVLSHWYSMLSWTMYFMRTKEYQLTFSDRFMWLQILVHFFLAFCLSDTLVQYFLCLSISYLVVPNESSRLDFASDNLSLAFFSWWWVIIWRVRQRQNFFWWVRFT